MMGRSESREAWRAMVVVVVGLKSEQEEDGGRGFSVYSRRGRGEED